MLFCPKCGNQTLVLYPPRCYQCEACAFVYYQNAAAASVAMIHSQGELLVTQRAFEPAKGMLDLPGGFQEFGESLEEGLRRELQEELYLDIAIEQMRYLFSYPNRYPYKEVIYHSCDAYFEIILENKTHTIPADDVEKVMWIPFEKLALEEFGFENIQRAIKRRFGVFLENKK